MYIIPCGRGVSSFGVRIGRNIAQSGKGDNKVIHSIITNEWRELDASFDGQGSPIVPNLSQYSSQWP